MTDPAKKHIEVVGAVIVRDSLVLCAQRGPGGETGGLWEFPGGKIEPGESPRDALVREIFEELGCHVLAGGQVATTTHEYDFGVITLTTFYCDLVDGTPMTTEHAALAWLAPGDLGSIAWAPADIPTVVRIQQGVTRPSRG